MRGVVLHAPSDIRVEDRPDPVIERPTDAIVRMVATCVCGSDLWPYRGYHRVQTWANVRQDGVRRAPVLALNRA